MFFVEGLGDLEGATGGEAEAGVGLALEGGEIVEERRDLGLGLFFLGDGAGLAAAFLLDRLGAGALPDALRAGILLGAFFESLVEPAAAVGAGGDAEIAKYLPVGAGFEGADFLLPLDEDGERRGLDAAGGGLLEAADVAGIEGGQGAGAVDADQPVALRAGDGGIGQGAHFLVGAQVIEGGADSLRGHGLEPEALDRFFGAGES